ncbi:MAG: SEC-C metal-binding domain-containing protein [Bryobacteraceae bacterium]|jgi:transposase-like protein
MVQVIDALSSGANLGEAAAAAGVHRNTIANWRRSSPEFQQALAQAQSDRDFLFRERAAGLADLAFTSLREILSDPKASPSVRLKAATFIIQTAMGTPARKATKPFPFNAPLDSGLAAAPSQVEEKLTGSAQECTPAANPQNMHNHAQKQEPYRRLGPKIGRNDPCPCGSGQKYKRCCLGKSQTAAA